MQDPGNNLNAFRYDIKAEVVISNLIRNGVIPDRILIDFKGSHRKNWDHDILTYEVSGDNIILKLSRDGLFHSLPEYLFLKKVEGNIEEKEKIRKFNTKQEKNAKILFNPVENKIFQDRVALETCENELLASLNSNDNKYLNDFWRIDPHLDNTYKIKLMKVMPYLYSIVGDFNLTAKCFQYFLDTDVGWALKEMQVPVPYSLINDQEIRTVDTCGDNMITSGDFTEFSKTLVFTIGPVPGTEIESYLENGKKGMLINHFANYFVPLDYDIDFVIEIDKSDSDFTLNEAYLGLNSSINQ